VDTVEHREMARRSWAPLSSAARGREPWIPTRKASCGGRASAGITPVARRRTVSPGATPSSSESAA